MRQAPPRVGKELLCAFSRRVDFGSPRIFQSTLPIPMAPLCTIKCAKRTERKPQYTMQNAFLASQPLPAATILSLEGNCCYCLCNTFQLSKKRLALLFSFTKISNADTIYFCPYFCPQSKNILGILYD